MVTYIAVRSQLQTYTTLSAKEPAGPHKQGSQFYLKSVLEIVIHFAQDSDLPFGKEFSPGDQVKQSQIHIPTAQPQAFRQGFQNKV